MRFAHRDAIKAAFKAEAQAKRIELRCDSMAWIKSKLKERPGDEVALLHSLAEAIHAEASERVDLPFASSLFGRLSKTYECASSHAQTTANDAWRSLIAGRAG